MFAKFQILKLENEKVDTNSRKDERGRYIDM